MLVSDVTPKNLPHAFCEYGSLRISVDAKTIGGKDQQGRWRVLNETGMQRILASANCSEIMRGVALWNYTSSTSEVVFDMTLAEYMEMRKAVML